VTPETGQTTDRASPGAGLGVPYVKMRFADGTLVWARRGKAADYIFHPVVLKNTFITVLIYGLLVWRSDFSGLDVWQIVTVWMGVSLTVLMWLYFATATITFLAQARIISSVFTPFFTVPLVCVNEAVTQVVLAGLTGEPLVSFGSVLHFLIRDIIVVLLFDIQFGNFVAPHHPMISTTDPEDAANATPDALQMFGQKAAFGEQRTAVVVATPSVVKADPAPIQASEKQPVPAEPAQQSTIPSEAGKSTTLAIGGEVLRIADLVSVHAEDHYVRVQTRDSRLLLRGRFSDVVEKLGTGMGIQVTRSDWVSRPHVVAIQRTEDYKLYVLTSDQQTLAVARARKADVMGFARQHDIPITRRR
jgi:hypothetical protein